MKRVIYINNAYGAKDKYIFKEEYNGFGIYQRITPNGLFVHQEWLISNNAGVELVIQSYNYICKEELLDMIDSYNENGKFGVKAFTHCDALLMHPNGKLV